MINKKELARLVSKKTTLNQLESNIVVDALFDEILLQLAAGEEVSIVGFGKFYLYQHSPRPVRNPKTQQSMTLDSYKSMRFKASTVVKKLLKDGFKDDKN